MNLRSKKPCHVKCCTTVILKHSDPRLTEAWGLVMVLCQRAERDEALEGIQGQQSYGMGADRCTAIGRNDCTYLDLLRAVQRPVLASCTSKALFNFVACSLAWQAVAVFDRQMGRKKAEVPRLDQEAVSTTQSAS